MKSIASKSLLAICLSASMLSAAPVLAAEETEKTSESQPAASAIELRKDKDTGWYTWTSARKSARADLLTPNYYIFAGQLSLEEADQLVAELDMQEAADTWGSSIAVIVPKNGKEYTAEDVKAFETALSHAPIKNVKLIGIDEGATFINNEIADHANYVAGMLLIGGEMAEDKTVDQAIPVYLVNASEKAKAFYEEANGQEGLRQDLQQVITAEDENNAQAFANACAKIFTRNYRAHNDVTEFYNLPALADKENTLEYQFELSETPDLAALNVTYNEKVHQSIEGLEGSDYAWFEYLPAETLEAAEKSVPLVVSLHGNQNDPRLQGDTSGWIEEAAKEKFMVVSPEYQTAEQNAYFTQEGNTDIYGKVEGMKEEGFMKLIEQLQKTYPQIDPSRIYVTGLSQGGAMTSLLGLKHSDTFAAAASVSGVNAYHEEIEDIQADYDGMKIPYLYLCGDHDFFQMIPVDGSSKHGTSELFGDSVWANDENVHIYSIITGYQSANGLVTAEMDMEKDPWFGIAFDETSETTLGGHTMHVGRLLDEEGHTLMELNAIEDQAHWNNKAEAEYIWNFFSQYARDTETGELVFADAEAAPAEPAAKDEHKGAKTAFIVIALAALLALICIPNKKQREARAAHKEQE